MGATLLSSCQKEIVEETNSPTTQSITMSATPSFTYYQFGTDITENDFILNPIDAADEAYNKVEYALTLCMLELYNNHSDLFNKLVQKTNSTQNKCYNLFTFASEQPSVNAIFNTVFASRFNDFGSYGNYWKNYVVANYKYDIDYIPFASFANRGNINFELQPFLAAPFEIDEEKFPDFDDNIPLWVKTSEGTKFSTLNLSTALTLSNPPYLLQMDKLVMKMLYMQKFHYRIHLALMKVWRAPYQRIDTNTLRIKNSK